jgi:hypothetical protein
VRRYLPYLIDFGIGILVGVVLHYYLYRVGLPSEQFIYQSF